MAAATCTVNILSDNQSWVAGNMSFYLLTLAFTASPATYTTGGIACSFATDLIKATRTPQLVVITSQSAQAAQADYTYKYIPGSNNTNGLVKIFSAGVELTGGAAIPSGVSGDTIQALAMFLGQN